MKQIIYAISTLALVFAVGCSKDDVSNSSSEYQLVVNVEKASFGGESRAARNSWEDGDVVYVFFNGDYGYEKYLTLTYNAGSWASAWVGTTAEEVAAKETKELRAGYINVVGDVWSPVPGMLMVYANGDNGVCYMECNNGTYSVVENRIILDIVMRAPCAQVTVRGIDVSGNWTLCCDKLIQTTGFSIVESGSLSPANGAANDPLQGFANEDGVSFFGGSNAYSPTSLTFTLSNGTTTYKRTFTDKILLNGSAIIMDGPIASPAKWEVVTE